VLGCAGLGCSPVLRGRIYSPGSDETIFQSLRSRPEMITS
jgi:hypothetical protein